MTSRHSENQIQTGQGLLKVPSRTSSQQKTHNIPTAHSSAVTVGESRSSIGAISKESHGSDGDMASTNENGPGPQQGQEQPPLGSHTQPSSPSTTEQKQKKRRGGFLSFLGCCGAADLDNENDGETENAHKLNNIPQRQTTAKTPNANASTADGVAGNNADNGNSSPAVEGSEPIGSAHTTDQQILAPEEKAVVAADAGNSASPDQRHNNNNGEDMVMQNANDTTAYSNHDETAAIDAQSKPIPPPPPGSGVAVAEPGSEGEESRKWLLPPVAPEHKGRKCLVLDLDETLVHSSFKVCNLCTGHWLRNNPSNYMPDSPSRRHHNTC